MESANQSSAFFPTELLRVEKLGKRYGLNDRPLQKMRRFIPRWLGGCAGPEFSALENISFSVQPGDILGIIGRNGSGKSTLLQLIAGVLQPSEGWIKRQGQVLALLELGCGFNPEFSGRENVDMWGALMGLSRRETARRFPGIASFADIGDYIHRPVKTYSSGMFLRLAFATMTSLGAEILLIDEALAVGDIFFRQKCHERLNQIRSQGTAIILVSHAMAEIEQYCSKVLVLHQGRCIFQGSPTEAVKRYYLIETQGDLMKTPSTPELSAQPRTPAPLHGTSPEALLDISHIQQVSNGAGRVVSIGLCDGAGHPMRVFQQGDTASFRVEIEWAKDVDVPTVGVELVSDRGVIVHGKTSLEYGTPLDFHPRRGDRLRVRQDIQLDLAVGEYSINVGVGSLSRNVYDKKGLIPPVELYAQLQRVCVVPRAGTFAVGYRKPGDLPVRLLHHGLANLPGNLMWSHLPRESFAQAENPMPPEVRAS